MADSGDGPAAAPRVALVLVGALLRERPDEQLHRLGRDLEREGHLAVGHVLDREDERLLDGQLHVVDVVDVHPGADGQLGRGLSLRSPGSQQGSRLNFPQNSLHQSAHYGFDLRSP